MIDCYDLRQRPYNLIILNKITRINSKSNGSRLDIKYKEIEDTTKPGRDWEGERKYAIV